MTTSEFPTGPAEAASESTPAARRHQDDLLDHEYDGIREYDNPLPRWWVWIFTGSFVFAIGYFFHYHISHNGSSVAEAYEAEVRIAEEAEAKRSLAEHVSEESLQKLSTNQLSLLEAKSIFAQRCVVCHGEHGQGVIGPNLTDDYWIHGKGTLLDIYTTINEGVAVKGMPAWGKSLPPGDVRKLAALVGTLRGKHLPGKPPEGERVTQ